jgi:hypothetical protein
MATQLTPSGCRALRLSIQNTIESLYDRCAIMVREASMYRFASIPDQTIKECRSAVTTLLSAIYSTPSDTIPKHSWNTKEAVVARQFLHKYIPWDSIDKSFRVVMLDILGTKEPIKNTQKRFEAILYHRTQWGMAVGAQGICTTPKMIAETVGSMGSIPIIHMFMEDAFIWLTTTTWVEYMEVYQKVVKGMCKGFLDDSSFLEAMHALPGVKRFKQRTTPIENHLVDTMVNMLKVELSLAHRDSLLPMIAISLE